MARRSFVEKTLESLAGTLERSLYAEDIARRPGLLQRLDPRVKVVVLAFALLVAASLRTWPTQLVLLAILVGLLLASRLSPATVARLLFGLPLFSLLVSVPALVLVPGPPLVYLPFGLAITSHGVSSVVTLLLRVTSSLAAALALVLTTRWTDLLAAFRALRIPLLFVLVLAMAYRYVFVLLELLQDLLLARRSRSLAASRDGEQRRWLVSALGVLFQRSLRTSEQVYLAMTARGFRGEPRSLRPRALADADWLALSFGSAVCAALWLIDLARP
ncbi:cobalt ECF transporter T component CbiQ [Thermomicrobium sp. 4228-Ro]|uniref:cobalt ECF transporter T component CbiQ n=1 Tax=Thermomicrobium sp. 4228-Ro TaxID=2993937 RepID=UPI0022489700|nr:cobalt ECF transporter T component CbiQ [Thermomicrobium sp. 4228-Ro]MCX2727766.1 cobalt ECF transporter T component CbiQ [Thermomicrobium sp. 4228-Ro]